jgi:hypothetical protein
MVAAVAAALIAVLAAVLIRDRPEREASGEHDRDIVPITTVPATNVSASAAPPPAVLLEGPLLTPPSTTATSTTIVEGAAAASITESQADSFLRGYFDAVASGSYERSWSQLAPEFQRGKARSYDYYVGFWNDNDVEMGDVELVDATEGWAIVNVDLLWNGNNNPVTDQFTLRVGDDRELLIAEQTTVG